MSDDETLSPENQKAAVEFLEQTVCVLRQYTLPQHIEVAVQKIQHILDVVHTTGKLTKRLWMESEADIQLLLKYQDNNN
jgi:hypothetical protein